MEDDAHPSPEDDELEILLPPGPVREWVVTSLADLIARCSYAPLVVGPLVEPSDRFFPDPWTGEHTGLARLLRRLTIYADLEHAPIELIVQGEPRPVPGGRSPPVVGGVQEPAVWFMGQPGGTLRFGADRQELAQRDRLDVVASAARAVTEAYRSVRGLPTPSTVAGQRLVDLTTVFLGFGILTTDASLRMQSRSAGGLRSSRSRTRLGVLAPQALAFALALQLRVRGTGRAEVRRIVRHLQANQAGYLRQSLRWIDDNWTDARSRLGIPAPAQWMPPPDLDELTAPLDDAELNAEIEGVPAREDEGEPPESPDRVEGMNTGKPVFLVERSMSLRLARLLGLPVLLLGLVASRMSVDREIPMGNVALAALALAGAGLFIGRFFRDRRCSEPRCGVALKPGATRCPHCGGTIAGTIHHPKQRLAAEEALARNANEDEDQDKQSK